LIFSSVYFCFHFVFSATKRRLADLELNMGGYESLLL
jgi:hypothetical protein